ncbi:Choline transporter-like protein 5-A, partial [Nibea albiflora]
MHILKKEKDAATAAEEAVFVAAAENAEIDSRHDIDLPLLPSNPAQRTSEYVLQHSGGASERISMYSCSQPAREKVEQERSSLRNEEDVRLETTPKEVNQQPAVNATLQTHENFSPVHKQRKRYSDPHADSAYLRKPTQQRWDPDNPLKQTAATPDVAKDVGKKPSKNIFEKLSWLHGDPKKVLHPTDSYGQFCGQKGTSNAKKPILFYFNILKCTSPATLINLQCPTTQMCVSKCPDRFATYSEMQLQHKLSKSYWEYYRQFLSQVLRDEDCPSMIVPSRPRMWYCSMELSQLRHRPGSDVGIVEVGLQTDLQVYLQLTQTWIIFC